uniref:Uncharacterized protein n=1 Tax=Arundo donax TaxID=35708 RepID=A0A0A9CI82_ARUDO
MLVGDESVGDDVGGRVEEAEAEPAAIEEARGHGGPRPDV